MARIRTIKPEFFTSDDVCALSPLARLLFIGCWCEADREGRLEWRPRTLKRKYLPEDDCDADAICNELVSRGLIVLYGQGLAYVTGFAKHQVINSREAQSKLPEPQEVTCNAHALPETTTGKGKEGKGREEYSVAKATGAPAPQFDPVKALFDDGVKLLMDTGTNEKQARSLVGKWRRDHGDEATRDAIQAAYDGGITQPCEWIPKRLGFAGKPHETWDQRRIREAMEAIQ